LKNRSPKRGGGARGRARSDESTPMDAPEAPVAATGAEAPAAEATPADEPTKGEES
jgi:hypothetical protein